MPRQASTFLCNLDRPETCNLSVSASQIAGITGLSIQSWKCLHSKTDESQSGNADLRRKKKKMSVHFGSTHTKKMTVNQFWTNKPTVIEEHFSQQSKLWGCFSNLSPALKQPHYNGQHLNNPSATLVFTPLVWHIFSPLCNLIEQWFWVIKLPASISIPNDTLNQWTEVSRHFRLHNDILKVNIIHDYTN